MIYTCTFQTYLEELPNGTVVLGATADTSENNMHLANGGLTMLGIDNSLLTFRSSMAFIAKKGYPDDLVLKCNERYDGPSFVMAAVSFLPGKKHDVFLSHGSGPVY